MTDLPIEAMRLIAQMQNMRRELSILEDDAAAGDEEAKQLCEVLYAFLDWVRDVFEGRDAGPFDFDMNRVQAIFRGMN
jgi:hypothetical protein